MGSCHSRLIVQHNIGNEISALLKQQTDLARATRSNSKAKILQLQLPHQSVHQRPSQSIPSLPSSQIPSSSIVVSQSNQPIPKKLSSASGPTAQKNLPNVKHPWIVLQKVTCNASARDVELFLDGINLSPPGDTSLDGVIAVCYSTSQDLFMDVYLRCQTCDGAQVASLRSNEPFMVSNHPVAHSIAIRVNLPPCEVFWARGVGILLTGRKSARSVIEEYSTDYGLPKSLLVPRIIQSVDTVFFFHHTHFKLFQCLNSVLNLKAEKKRKRDSNLGNQDHTVENLWLFSNRQTCAMFETKCGVICQGGTLMNTDDPLESFLGVGILASPSRTPCLSCLSSLRELETLLVSISSYWANLMVFLSLSDQSLSDRGPVDYLDRYWQTYSGLYKYLLKVYHQKGHISSCTCSEVTKC